MPSLIDLPKIKACVFDAYGTLFDVASVAKGARTRLGDRWEPLSDLWRTKQLQYTWLRGLAGHHADFWQVTADALDFALSTLQMDAPGLREELMNLYLCISAYPEVPSLLAHLRRQGLKLAILSNGTPAMLQAAVSHSGMAGAMDGVYSVEEVGVFKPHPKVYELAPRHLGLDRKEICFVSSNAWDAFSAKAFGFRVVWCNRFGQAPERLPAAPDLELPDLSALPIWLGYPPT